MGQLDVASDRETIKAIEKRIPDLREMMAEEHDLTKRDEWQTEIDAYEAYVKRSTREVVGKTSRRLILRPLGTSDMEAARKAATNNIARGLEEIKRAMPRLAEHLRQKVIRVPHEPKWVYNADIHWNVGTSSKR